MMKAHKINPNYLNMAIEVNNILHIVRDRNYTDVQLLWNNTDDSRKNISKMKIYQIVDYFFKHLADYAEECPECSGYKGVSGNANCPSCKGAGIRIKPEYKDS